MQQSLKDVGLAWNRLKGSCQFDELLPLFVLVRPLVRLLPKVLIPVFRLYHGWSHAMTGAGEIVSQESTSTCHWSTLDST
jgi:hypothetical protein